MKHRPADVNQLGKLVVDIATGDVQDEEPKSGRTKGGHARAATMTPERRKEIAAKGAQARWAKRKVAADAAT
ncbi:MAG: histone H1 [Deltaproteobacteria bacterium]|nr:histone H1 [Deltaproteobacteria bacterium]